MQIRNDKYNLSKSSFIEMREKNLDLKVDIKLEDDTTKEVIGALVLGTVVDSNNNPIKGAIVRLLDKDLHQMYRVATDDNGKYVISYILFSETYTVSAIANEKLLATSESFTLSSGIHKSIDFTLYDSPNITLGAINGRITDLNSNELFGAVLSLYSLINNTSTLIATTFSDENGHFIFSQLNEGNYSIAISKLGYIATQLNSTVTKNKITLINQILTNDPNTSKGVISGIITNDLNKIISNADVILYVINEDKTLTPLAYTKTNISGLYTFINVAKGNYIIKSSQSETVNIDDKNPPSPVPSISPEPISPTNPSPIPATIPETVVKPIPTPDINSVNFLPLGSYEAANGTFERGAEVNKITRFVENLGGENDGAVTIDVTVTSSGLYNLIIEYLSADTNRTLSLDINGKNIGIFDDIAITPGSYIEDSKTLIIISNLESGKNTIKFHGDGTNLAPNIGILTVKSISEISKKPHSDVEQIASYKFTLGNISSGAKVDSNNDFVTNLGGVNDESVTININVKNKGIYNLLLKYKSSNNKTLKIDVNGENTNIIYNLPTSIDSSNILTFTIPIKLNEGDNSLEFHGNGKDLSPDLTELIIKIPPITSNLTKGILFNGATINPKTKFIENLGGENDGSVAVSVNTSDYGIYTLSLKYLGIQDNQILSIDVNGINTGTIYNIPKTEGLELNNVAVFTLPLNLKNGRNTVTFHGNKTNFSPALGSFTLQINSISTPNITKDGVYNVGLGDLTNGAVLNIDYNFAEWLGGPLDGSSTLNVKLEQGGIYTLSINYKNNNGPLRIEVNEIDSGSIYTLPEGTTNIFNTDLKFKKGNNLIKFHGDGVAYAPDLGDFTLTLKNPDLTSLPEGTYDLTLGILENGAKIDESNNIDFIGGLTDGSVTITVNAPNEGLYDINVEYESEDNDRPMMVDINGLNDDIIYILPMTSSWVSAKDKNFIFQAILNTGNNTVKFHGNGIDYAPRLSLVKINSEPIDSISLPEGTYNAKDGLLENGSKLQVGTGFIGNLGGALDGSVTISSTVNSSTIYNLSIEYISPNKRRSIKIEVNGVDTGTVYSLPLTWGKTKAYAKIFNIPMPLNNGENKIKIHGDGVNESPSIGRIIISDLSSIKTLTFDANKGILQNGAVLNEETQFVRLLGGLEDGSVSLPVNVIGAGLYILSFKYIAPDADRPLNIDINDRNTGRIYTTAKTAGKKVTDALTFNVLINLKSGENIIKFHGDGVNYAPNIGTFTLTPSSEVSIANYNIATGLLENGATINSTTKFLTNIGGTQDGASTVTVNVPNSGLYSLVIQYICADDDKPLKVDVNGISIGIYTLPMTLNYTVAEAELFNIQVNLNPGNNSIKFHGNNIDNGPDLGKFTITPITESTINALPSYLNNDYTIGSYELSKGSFLGGATVDYNTGLVKNIGGSNNGSCTITVYANNSGNYLLRTQYSSANTESFLLYEVNGKPTGLIYLLQITNFNKLAITSTKVYLNAGYNTIKFYSNANSYGPMLGTATIGYI